MSGEVAHRAQAQRSPLVGDVLYGVAGALATLTVVTFVVAAVTSRTTSDRRRPA
ncbi:hypothetical protein [Nonomuraea sp. NPDC050202]|jgi:hypothetical protein|uniref:hypothetical protein n=1 Tax=Nonomuraea sp. NPDC050202 TaxID=3155035 RepID=UPI0033BFC589